MQPVTICHRLELLKIFYGYSLRLGVGDFATGAFADVASDVDDEDFICHVDLSFVHIIEHSLGAFSPDFVVSAMSEQANGDDDIPFKGESLLNIKVLLLELRAAAEGYYFVFADHGDVIVCLVDLDFRSPGLAAVTQGIVSCSAN